MDYIPTDLSDYAERYTTDTEETRAKVAQETSKRPDSMMLTGKLEGQFLTMMARLVNARRVLEIGCYTGYSALSLAQGTAPDGKVISLELSKENAAEAQAHIDASGLKERISIVVGDARETIKTIQPSFDVIFLDADKEGYRQYYDTIFERGLLAPNGILLCDNTLWYGHVMEPGKHPDDKLAGVLHDFNQYVMKDPRSEVVMLTLRDGVSMIRHASKLV